MDSVEIVLKHRDGSVAGVALVDAADAPAVLQFRWHVLRSGRSCYAQAMKTKGHQVLMHREVLGLSPVGKTTSERLEVDHINQNGLDNRRSNLRIVSHAENLQNNCSHQGSTSAYRGVYWNKAKGKWRGLCKMAGRKYHIGYFDSESEAAMAAKAWRLANMPYAVS